MTLCDRLFFSRVLTFLIQAKNSYELIQALFKFFQGLQKQTSEFYFVSLVSLFTDCI